MRRVNTLFIVIFLLYCFFNLASPVQAKKKIGSGGGSAITTNNGIVISPRLRKDRKALLVSFSNLATVSSFSYELTYLANNIDQGVFGQVTPKGENFTSRELLFGTCSHNVCRYHTNIQNMRFVVTATLKNGQKITKRYRVKP